MTTVDSSIRAGSRLAQARTEEQVASQGTTGRERAILSFFVLWVGVGLAIDTRKHNTEESLDTFFTSAHGLLYAGWFASAVYLLFIARRRMQAGAQGFDAVPHGLIGASVGAVLFGISGLLDMGWHIKWGVEQNVAILFSPTHLGLMTSFFLLAFGPIRALWVDTSGATGRLSLAKIAPAAISMGVIGTIFSVFLSFNSPFTPISDGGVFTTELPLPVPQLALAFQLSQITGLLLFTVAIIGSMLLLVRRWDIPFGTLTATFAVTAISALISVDFILKPLFVSMAVAGLLMDVAWLLLRQISSRRSAFRLFAFVSPLLLWGTYIAFTIRGHNLVWQREFWTGTLLWTAIIGLGLSAILLPPRSTPVSHLD